MAKRDMNKIAREATIPTQYDMTYGEAIALSKTNNPLNAISTAFKYGFAMGQRYQKNTEKREQARKVTPDNQTV